MYLFQNPNWFFDLDEDIFYLTEDNGEAVIPLLELTEEEFQTLKTTSLDIYDYHYQVRRKEEVLRNLIQIENTLKQKREEFGALKEQAKEEFAEDCFIEFNRITTNFCSSFQYYVERIETFVKNRYGEDSVEFQAIDKFFENLYDGYLEYRFFYNLRNYSQHVYFPLNLIHMDHFRKEGIKIFEPCFQKNKLYESKTFKKKLDPFLKHYGNDFPLEPFLEKIRILIKRIHKKFGDIVFPEILPKANLMLSYLDHRNIDGKISYGKYVKTGPTTGRWETTDIPLPLLRRVFEDKEGKSAPF